MNRTPRLSRTPATRSAHAVHSPGGARPADLDEHGQPHLPAVTDPPRQMDTTSGAPRRTGRRLTWPPARPLTLVVAALAALAAAVVPLSLASAVGFIWLPAVQATQWTLPPEQNLLHPVMASDNSAVFILTTRWKGSQGAATTTNVFVTIGTMASDPRTATWTMHQISDRGPDYFTNMDGLTSLANDPSTHRLYAAWVYHLTACHDPAGCDAVGVWTSSDFGSSWSGPIDLAHGIFTGPPSVVAAQGKVYVAFSAGTHPGPCNDTTSRTTDVLLATYDGGAWSTPRNLTSCVSADKAFEGFDSPKLASDDQTGALHLVSNTNDSIGGLWYMDNVGGAWSPPVRIVPPPDPTELPASHASPFDYSIAASDGVTDVAYVHNRRHPETAFGYHDIYLATRPDGGTWTAGDVTRDAANCNEYDVSLVARHGRVDLAYIVGSTGNCPGVSSDYNVAHVLTGTPGDWTNDTPLGVDRSCTSPVLSSGGGDGNPFRLALDCGRGRDTGSGNVFYASEFLDKIGPTITQLSVPATATAGPITVTWQAQDPMPGAGVAFVQVQVRQTNDRTWQDVVPGRVVPGRAAATSLSYTVQAGHQYIFRVRAIDKVDNRGAWRTSRPVTVS